jgi:DUF1680 family protein
VAVERGPVVYCVEQADLPDGVAVDDLVLRRGDAAVTEAAGGLRLRCGVVAPGAGLYRPGPAPVDAPADLEVTAVPFATWGNRAPGAMRVWLPLQS